MPKRSASSRACRATTRAWSRGWCAITWSCRSPRRSRTSAIPQVINAFARKVGDETHLDYLYVLTCADVRGTNPKLWNSWKASLFHEFYERVKRALRRGLESPIDHGRADARDAGRRRARCCVAAGVSPRATSTRAWARLSAAVLPAAHARGSRLAHAAARGPRSRLATSRWWPCEPRSDAAPPRC